MTTWYVNDILEEEEEMLKGVKAERANVSVPNSFQIRLYVILNHKKNEIRLATIKNDRLTKPYKNWVRDLSVFLTNLTIEPLI